MKIYFAGSIRGGRDDQKLYFEIIKLLGKYGEVLTEHVGGSELTSLGEQMSESKICARDLEWLKDADIVVAEVSTPSLGVGYELGVAESLKKPTICLYRVWEGKSLSAMVSGNPYFKIHIYSNLGDIESILESSLKDFK